MKKTIIGALAVLPLTVAGTFTNAHAAHAAKLNGSITINGNSTTSYNQATDRIFIDFKDVDDIFGTGDFAPPVAGFNPNLDPAGENNTLPYSVPGFSGAIIDIKDLTLTKLPTAVPNYSSVAVANFLNFGTRTLRGEVGTLTFDLNKTDFIASITPIPGSNVITDISFPAATGVWKFNGNTIAIGNISSTQVPGAGSYTLSLTARAVPEPASIVGLGLVGGSILLSRRRKAAQN